MTDERRELLSQVAVWYYEDGLDQSEIAKRVHRSRSMVSRMLQEVRDEGLVEIRVKYPERRNAALERRLQDQFGLKDAYVISRPVSWDGELTLRLLGRAAAQCLQHYLRAGIRIGVAWSRTIHYVVSAVQEQIVPGSSVVQISGSVFSKNPDFDGPELVRTLAQRIGADYRYLAAPLVVRQPELRGSLLRERTIAETMHQAERSDLAIVGIGNLESEFSSLRSAGIVDSDSFLTLQSKGVVGDIIARQFDIDGRLVDDDFNDRVVGLDPASLRSIDTVIAVSAGQGKAQATLAALKGRWFNVLVSDEQTVTEMMSCAADHREREAG